MAGSHPRVTGPMLESKRCGALTRAGELCRAPAILGKQRCRMHGGRSPGAPKGNRNAETHGLWRQTEELKWQSKRLEAEVLAELRGETFSPAAFPPRKKNRRKESY
jgi:hypothetical protein